ncbi:MAG: protease inhibitor I42 family protein, partial [Eubacteriales bacterium]|nr:protease inhibitor I42 family protein [Eubacteriales bacterium]
MKNIKRLISLMLCIAIIFTAAGCKKKAQETVAVTEATTEAKTEAKTEGQATDAVPTECDYPKDIIEVTDNKEVMTVRLEANSTTGYSWQWKISDEEVFEFLTGEYIAPNDGALGAPGQWVGSFKPSFKKDGDVKVEFSYERIWESQPAKIFTIDVTVKDNKLYITNTSMMEKQMPVIADGTYTVEIHADDFRKEDDIYVADVQEPKAVTLTDAEVEGLNKGDVISLQAFGLYDIEVEYVDKKADGSIEINRDVRLEKEPKAGVWFMRSFDDDIITYPVSMGQVVFNKDTEFVDDMSRIAYEDEHKFATPYECVQNYGVVTAEIDVKDGVVKKIFVFY